MELHSFITAKNYSFNKSQKGNKSLFFQPKLTINQPNDAYEQEADAIADKLMRMPANENSFIKPSISFLQRKCAHCEEEVKKARRKENTIIQRQEPHTTDTPTQTPTTSPTNSPTTPPATTPVTIPGADFRLPVPDLLHPRTEPDFLSMRQPFFNRGATQLWDPNSALQVWQYNFDFFRRLGVPQDFSATLTNLTAPLAIDSQLKFNNPTWWEITDRELNTSTKSISLPLLQFNPNFSPVAPQWFKSIFGGGGSGGVQRKNASNEETSSLNATPTETYLQSAQSGGEPLNQKEKQFFETRMGVDFSNVRLHTDGDADVSAKNINALAYTQGNHIVFSSGNYHPETSEGKRLLAHELTHVVQQQGASSLVQRERELNADESKECLQKVDDSIKELETAAADPNKNLPDYIKEAIKVLKEKRQQGKVKCYSFDGTIHGRVDYAKDEIQYDGFNKDQINTTKVLHEAVHALHGKQHPAAAKEYGKAVGKDLDPTKKSDLDLLKWKAWTEYWAYRSSQEFYNDKQKSSEEEIHNTVMKIKEVDVAVRNVRTYDQSFDPSKWNPK